MSSMLPELPMLFAFISASFILAVIPGPVVLYVVMRTLTQGRIAGLASVLGAALGNFGNALCACFGLAALFAMSSLAFTVVKLAGALYLIYLGIKTLISAAQDNSNPVIPNAIKTASTKRLFSDGFLVALLNPKTTLFFAAFLPQFLNADAQSHIAPTLFLGMVFVIIATLTDAIYVLLAGVIYPYLSRKQKGFPIMKSLSGFIYIGLGILAAVTPQKQH